MTQQDALRMALDFNKIRCAVMMKCDSSQPTAAYIDAAIHAAIDAYESALAEQDDEAVAVVVNDELKTYAVLLNRELRHGSKLFTRPAPKGYTEHDIDVAIGVVEWDKLNLFATAEMVKQIVMRFAGSQVTMGVKRLSEDEIIAINDAMLGCAVMTPITFANALMDKMTGGGE